MTQDIWKEFNEQLLGFIKARVHNVENAEDILQEVFIKIHKNIEGVKDNKKIASWIYQITRNTIIDFYRKKKLQSGEYKYEELLSETIDEKTADFTKCLKPFIDRLAEKDKDILLESYYGTMSQKAYAEKNNISYTAAKSRVQRARKQLKKMFLNCCALQVDVYGNLLEANEKKCSC